MAEQQSFSTHRFHVGDFSCVAIDDGGLVYEPPTFPRPADFLFASAPSNEVVDAALKDAGLDRDTWDKWPSPYTCLLIDTGSDRVLIDTGAGDFTPNTGKLVGALLSEGVSPTEISAVIITHGHCDHINGCADENGRPRFPNARYVISSPEYEFWTGQQCENTLDEQMGKILIPIARKNLSAIADRLERITLATEVVPGVTARPAYGHTPGHLIVEINGGGQGTNKNERLVVLGDSIIHPLHCSHPNFSATVDVKKEEATITRRLLLDKLLKEGCLVHGYHFPFPGLGHIEASGDRCKFQPLNLSETPPQ